MKQYQSLILGAFVLLCSALLINSCDNDDDNTGDKEWELVWEDEFEGPAGQLPSAANWGYDIGTDWGNAQLEYDTDRPENVSLDGEGNLAITARREAFGGQPFTSARITTKDKFEQAYGRFEARIKLPYGPGIWPAFWMLGANIDEVPWPGCGEIDIMEYRGQETSTIAGSIHGPGYSGDSPITKEYTLPNARFDTDFYVFRIDWGTDYINFFVDDVLYQQIEPEDADGEWVFNQPFYIILNVAVGGNYVGFPTSETPFPQTMLVDWVRVYQEAK